MPEIYIILPEIYFPEFLGVGHVPPCSASPTPMGVARAQSKTAAAEAQKKWDGRWTSAEWERGALPLPSYGVRQCYPEKNGNYRCKSVQFWGKILQRGERGSGEEVNAWRDLATQKFWRGTPYAYAVGAGCGALVNKRTKTTLSSMNSLTLFLSYSVR